jgi:phosphoribosyl 1,2-cyclic phosphodiesterase
VRYSVLGSGSTANAYMFEDDTAALLVDNGFSVRELIRRAEAAGHDCKKLVMILLTHTHTDHVRGVGAAARKFGIPVAMHKNLPVDAVVLNLQPRIFPVETGNSYQVGTFSFTPFAISHDSPWSISYKISSGGSTFVIITDTGVVTPEMRLVAAESDVLFLEANYDNDLLREGPYPGSLKRRIASVKGHLSNDHAADFLEDLYRDNLRKPEKIYLCHLSGTNNTALHAAEACRRLVKIGLSISVCEKNGMYTGILG